MVELAIRDLKEGAGLEHVPSGNFHANSAWLQTAVLAHNLIRWTAHLGGVRVGDELTVARTMRTRLVAIPARLVNRAGRTTLRLPTRWPRADTFTTALDTLRPDFDPHPPDGLTAVRRAAAHHPALTTRSHHDPYFDAPRHASTRRPTTTHQLTRHQLATRNRIGGSRLRSQPSTIRTANRRQASRDSPWWAPGDQGIHRPVSGARRCPLDRGRVDTGTAWTTVAARQVNARHQACGIERVAHEAGVDPVEHQLRSAEHLEFTARVDLASREVDEPIVAPALNHRAPEVQTPVCLDNVDLEIPTSLGFISPHKIDGLTSQLDTNVNVAHH